MRVFEFPFRIEIGSVLDLDFMPDGTCVTIQGGAHQQFLLIGNERFFLPPDWGSPEHPFLRVMSDGRILVVDTSADTGTKGNAWILSIARPGLGRESAHRFFSSESFGLRSWARNRSAPLTDSVTEADLDSTSNSHPHAFAASDASRKRAANTENGAGATSTESGKSGSRTNRILNRAATRLDIRPNDRVFDSDIPTRTPSVDLRFTLEPSAVEIVCLWGMIAVAYHPLSAKAHGYSVHPLQRSGIAFYDHSGHPVMGLSQILSPMGLSIENVRCMSGISRSQLLLVPEKAVLDGREVENPIVQFDCATRKPKIYSAPFGKAEVCTFHDGLIHLSSPEGWEDQIITFDPETKISQHRGEFLGIFRSIEGGAFLAQLTESDYAVVLPGQPPETPPPQKSTLELLEPV